jgi:hypothetical protein
MLPCQLSAQTSKVVNNRRPVRAQGSRWRMLNGRPACNSAVWEYGDIWNQLDGGRDLIDVKLIGKSSSSMALEHAAGTWDRVLRRCQVA